MEFRDDDGGGGGMGFIGERLDYAEWFEWRRQGQWYKILFFWFHEMNGRA